MEVRTSPLSLPDVTADSLKTFTDVKIFGGTNVITTEIEAMIQQLR